MTEPKTTEKLIKSIYEIIGRLVFSNHPDWVWLMENRAKLQKLLDAGK